MVVAILCLSQGHGGLELYALREHRELEARGIKCISIVTQNSMLAKQLAEQSLNPLTLVVKNRRLPILAAKKLAKILDQHNVDVLHMHWNKDLNLAVLAKVFASRNIKLVYSRHMDITRSKQDVLHRWFYHRVDHVLTISKLVTDNCRKLLPLDSSSIQLLHIGVAAPRSTTPDCQLFFTESFPQRQLNIACFGRIEPYKGQHILIDAVKTLVGQGRDISATIIGHVMDPAYADKLKNELTTNQLSARVQFIGFVDNPIEMMTCFDVIVLTTYQETFGLVLAEAMRAGVAVIGTNAGGVPDIIDDGESGLLTEPGSPASLAAAIRQLYDDPTKRQKLSAEGKVRADERFSEEGHFNKLKSILSELAG
ncbi:MAG: glycosyltransferase family 4 protein [Thioalkalispiraceae bacterium]